jgi:hypothetical protein
LVIGAGLVQPEPVNFCTTSRSLSPGVAMLRATKIPADPPASWALLSSDGAGESVWGADQLEAALGSPLPR